MAYVARENDIQSFKCKDLPLRPRKRPQRSISRTFYANVCWLRRPGPLPGPGAEALTIFNLYLSGSESKDRRTSLRHVIASNPSRETAGCDRPSILWPGWISKAKRGMQHGSYYASYGRAVVSTSPEKNPFLLHRQASEPNIREAHSTQNFSTSSASDADIRCN